jgi:hypothetical protein
MYPGPGGQSWQTSPPRQSPPPQTTFADPGKITIFFHFHIIIGITYRSGYFRIFFCVFILLFHQTSVVEKKMNGMKSLKRLRRLGSSMGQKITWNVATHLGLIVAISWFSFKYVSKVLSYPFSGAGSWRYQEKPFYLFVNLIFERIALQQLDNLSFYQI